MENNHPNFYAIIPAYVRYDKNLTPNAKLIYGEITALANKRGYCWAANRYFADTYGVAINSASRWINQLIEQGYVRSELIKDTNTGEIKERRLYILNESPLHERMETGGNKVVEGGVHKIVEDNTIKTYNNKEYYNKGEQSSPGKATSSSSKLFSTKSNSTKLTPKQTKWLDIKVNILDSFNFSDKVFHAYADFLEGLAESNTLFPDNTIISQLTLLKDRLTDDNIRVKVIRDTITSGWKSISYAIDNLDKYGRGGFDTAGGSGVISEQVETTEERRARLAKMDEEESF